ncbi:MAG: hypothetical protein IPN34_05745 [Planctomycetes bacterium]|nr:hypothetical protein [Planctomycetota bacterium]
MAGTASANGVTGGGFEPALEARLASEQRSLRREALLLGALLAFSGIGWLLLRDGWGALWPLRLELGGALALSLAPALAAVLLGRRWPPRARRIARLDEELEARGALVAAAELPAAGIAPIGGLLRRGFARRLAAPLPASAQQARSARRRTRLLRWALVALLVWLWLWLARTLLGPGGPAPRGMEGELSGSRSAASGAGPASAGEPQSAEGGAGAKPPEEPASSEDPDPRDEPETPRGGTPEPPPPEPERRLEDFFVRLQEQAGGASSRELWVVPLAPAEGGAEPSSAGAGGRSESGASAKRPQLAGADLEELKRAVERAALPATLGERERLWVERYYAALRKLP